MRIGIIISVVLEIFKIPVFTIFETDEWNANRLYEQFSSKIVGDINRFTLFGFQKNNSKYLWEVFKKSSNHYINTQNNYKLIEVDGLVEYREYIEDVEIKSLVFEEDYYWDILQIANNKVVSLKIIIDELEKKYNKNITESVIITQIKEMKRP